MTGTANAGAPETSELAFVAEWLAQQFLVSPTSDQLEAMRSIQGQVALHWIGDMLGQRQAAEAICIELAGAAATALSVDLQRRHTALFGGIFRQRGAPPYASVWDGNGRLFGPAVERMQHLLRDLDMHLAPDSKEPADHVAIELVALAEALRQDRPQLVEALLAELRGWTGRFAAALISAESDGFYGNAARFLTALLDNIEQNSPAKLTQDMAATAARI
jgi:TorA-specific chaperone